MAPVEEFPVEKWDSIIAINLSSAFHTMRLAVPNMRQELGPHHQPGIGPRFGGIGRQVSLCSGQARPGGFDQGSSPGNRDHRRDRERHLPRLGVDPLVQKQIDARAEKMASPKTKPAWACWVRSSPRCSSSRQLSWVTWPCFVLARRRQRARRGLEHGRWLAGSVRHHHPSAMTLDVARLAKALRAKRQERLSRRNVCSWLAMTCLHDGRAATSL